MQRATLFLFTLIFLSQFALAIGIGPPRVNIDFIPNLAEDLSYIVVNTGDTPIDAILYVKGDLESYITLDKTRVTLAAHTQEAFTAFLRLPASITPGTHDMRIGALEAEAGQGATVGARAGVESQLLITAPFTGKFIRIVSSTEDVTLGDAAVLHFTIESIGTETINELYVQSTILDAGGATVAERSSPKQALQSSETATIDLAWTPTQRGVYTANSLIIYDGAQEQSNLTFRVGETSVIIKNITVSAWSPGQIAKVTISVENEWNEALTGVYAKVSVLENDTAVVEETSRDVTLGAFGGGTLEVFLDTTNLTAKDYAAKATVYFGGKTTEREFTMSPGQTAGPAGTPSSGIDPLIIIVPIVLAGVAFTAAGMIWAKRRRVTTW